MLKFLTTTTEPKLLTTNLFTGFTKWKQRPCRTCDQWTNLENLTESGDCPKCSKNQLRITDRHRQRDLFTEQNTLFD